MSKYQFRTIVLASAIGVTLLRLIAPSSFLLMGIGPCWELLWLLPWALTEGPISGALAGCSLGLILDAIGLGDGTEIPALVLLGFWWGWLGRRSPPIEKSWSLGLLAWLGSIFVGLSFWLQLWFFQMRGDQMSFHAWAFHTIFGQSILTGLLAPIACSWLLIILRRSKSSA